MEKCVEEKVVSDLADGRLASLFVLPLLASCSSQTYFSVLPLSLLCRLAILPQSKASSADNTFLSLCRHLVVTFTSSLLGSSFLSRGFCSFFVLFDRGEDFFYADVVDIHCFQEICCASCNCLIECVSEMRERERERIIYQLLPNILF